jgi:hypothetical protein
MGVAARLSFLADCRARLKEWNKGDDGMRRVLQRGYRCRSSATGGPGVVVHGHAMVINAHPGGVSMRICGNLTQRIGDAPG